MRRVQQYADDGYRYCIDLDLERFFDTVNHSKQIEVLSRTIKDGRLVSLIHKYLNAGVMFRNNYGDTEEGVPQGGPLTAALASTGFDVQMCRVYFLSAGYSCRIRFNIFISRKEEWLPKKGVAEKNLLA